MQFFSLRGFGYTVTNVLYVSIIRTCAKFILFEERGNVRERLQISNSAILHHQFNRDYLIKLMLYKVPPIKMSCFLFFFSGLLISYVFYKSEMEKKSGKEESANSHARNSLLKFIGGVTYRLIRLTPPYVVVLILTYLTGRWFYFNSVFDPPVGDHFTCQKYWWRNILYINTLFPVDQMVSIIQYNRDLPTIKFL